MDNRLREIEALFEEVNDNKSEDELIELLQKVQQYVDLPMGKQLEMKCNELIEMKKEVRRNFYKVCKSFNDVKTSDECLQKLEELRMYAKHFDISFKEKQANEIYKALLEKESKESTIQDNNSDNSKVEVVEHCVVKDEVLIEDTNINYSIPKKNMKKRNLIVGLLCVALFCIVVVASFNRVDEKCGDQATWALSENGVLTISGEGEMYNFLTKDVPWEKHIDDIREVVIENGITSIGEASFYDCKNLTTVNLASTVTVIRVQAFANCYSLNKITKTDNLTEIDSGAFDNCSDLKSITLSKKVTYLDDDAFAGCENLTVKCKKNSYVHKYCKSHGVKFKIVK